MSKRSAIRFQTEPVKARQITREESRSWAEREALTAFLTRRGYRWHKLPRWRSHGRGVEGDYFVGPPCPAQHGRSWLGGSIRRVFDHGCVGCIIHAPAPVHRQTIAERNEARRTRAADRQLTRRPRKGVLQTREDEPADLPAVSPEDALAELERGMAEIDAISARDWGWLSEGP